MKKLVNFWALVPILFFTISLHSQTVFWSEDFETDGHLTRYVADGQFLDGNDGSSEDYFGRIQQVGANLTYVGCVTGNIDVTNAYSGQSGQFFMAGEDMDDTNGCGADGQDTKAVLFVNANGHGINIDGASERTFSILVANGANNLCGVATSRWDQGEGLMVVYSKDGGAEVEALCFAPDLECSEEDDVSNEPLNLDLDCDGDGEDGFVGSAFTNYSFMIPAGGTTLDIQILIDADSGDEEIAFDNIRLAAVTHPLDPLPVEWKTFNVRQEGRQVVLSWSTETEKDNDFYSILRSNDGYNFREIGRVPAKGNSLSELNYNFLDRSPQSGINYYQVKQSDIDGSYSFSDLRTLDFKSAIRPMEIYPNPSSDFIYMSEVPENLDYKLFSNSGELVSSGIFTPNGIDLSQYSSGIYFIKYAYQNEYVIQKIVKVGN